MSDDKESEGKGTEAKKRNSALGLTPGSWFPSDDALVRFMPLASTHAPHVLGFIKLVSWGHLDENVTSLPCSRSWWPEGGRWPSLSISEPERAVEFRSTTGCRLPAGDGHRPGAAGRDAAPVDVAILCVAGFSQVSGNPEHILSNVRPRHIVGGHWEDFFIWPDRKDVRSAPGTSIKEFVERARKVSPARIFMVEPETALVFPVGAATSPGR